MNTPLSFPSDKTELIMLPLVIEQQFSANAVGGWHITCHFLKQFFNHGSIEFGSIH